LSGQARPGRFTVGEKSRVTH